MEAEITETLQREQVRKSRHEKHDVENMMWKNTLEREKENGHGHQMTKECKIGDVHITVCTYA